MSPRSAASDWVKHEVNWAFANRRDCIVPVLLEECDPLEFHLGMPRIQFIDFRKISQGSRQKLLSIWGLTGEASLISNELNLGKVDAFRHWLHENDSVLVDEFAPRLNRSDRFSSTKVAFDFPMAGGIADFVLINYLAVIKEASYLTLTIGLFGVTEFGIGDEAVLAKEAERLAICVQWCTQNEVALRQGLATKLVSPFSEAVTSGTTVIHEYGGILICGRRVNYSVDANQLRRMIFENSGRTTEVVSYDRILDLIDKESARLGMRHKSRSGKRE